MIFINSSYYIYMYFIHFRCLNSIVYRFFKFVIYAFQPFGCKVNSINKTIYLSIENKGLNQKKTKPKMLSVADEKEDCIHGMIYV